MTRPLTTFTPANRLILNPAEMRFTPCVSAGLLLKRSAVTADGAWDDGRFLFSRANPEFGQFQDRRHHVVQVRFMNKLVLKRCEIFRGKLSQSKTQPHLEERTPSAPSR